MTILRTLLATTLLLSGCSGGAVVPNGNGTTSSVGDGGTADAKAPVTEAQATPFLGAWSGTLDQKESAAFTFAFADGVFKAQHCERLGKDCNDLTEVTIKGSTFTGTLHFESDVVGTDGLPTGAKKPEQVLFSLTLSDDKETLSGTYNSSKCTCSGAINVTKQ